MSLKKFKFKIIKENKYARLGKIETHRGNIDTPAFMPVGTQATVKGAFINDIIKTKSQIILSNTYHLMIRPGVKRIKSSGGLHEYMNCNLPILTDSGGFQVMSLSKLNKVDKEKGAIFRSHVDGKKIILSPEESIRVQKGLNSDIVMVMDECLKKNNDYNKTKNSVEISTYWAKRSKKAFGKNPHKALFGIVQGGLFQDLRLKSLSDLIKINFDGYAIGGLAVGESQNEMFKVLDSIKDYMPKNKPRYLMGVGTPSDIIGAVARGVDMFDCVMPTRSGRTGLAFTWNGRINIRNSKYKKDKKPLNKNDNVISASTVVNLGGNYDPNNILGYSELAGGRIETSYLRGTGGSEIGPYIGFGIGLENFVTVLGFDFRKYTRYQNSPYDKKIGAQIEANFSRHGTVFHFRPSFSTITNKQKKMYWGVQGMIALGSSLLTEVWWYENDGSISTPFEEEDLWYLNDANSEITYDFFSSGFGLSSGYEFNVANFRLLKKKNISLLHLCYLQ